MRLATEPCVLDSAAAMLTLIDADVVIVAPLASPSISTFDGCSSAFEAAAHL